VNAWAERSCSNPCSNTADFVDVRECSPASKSLAFLRIRTLTNSDERAAEDWGSRGRRFKSCHPDGKQQVRGRFGQNPRRPLCCRVAIGVATAHILSCPLPLRAAGRRARALVDDLAVHVPGDRDEGVPEPLRDQARPRSQSRDLTDVDTGPGGHCGATQESSAADLPPHIGTSDQPLPGPAQPTLPRPIRTRKTATSPGSLTRLLT
jgi:hypothetical protein